MSIEKIDLDNALQVLRSSDDLSKRLKARSTLYELLAERDRLRQWIDTIGRTCPSETTVNAVLAE